MKEAHSSIRTFSFRPKASGGFTVMFVPSHPLQSAELEAASVPPEIIKEILAPNSSIINQGKHAGQLIVVDNSNPKLSFTTYHLRFVDTTDILLSSTKQKDSVRITLEMKGEKIFLTKLQ